MTAFRQPITAHSFSTAADNGYRALADLATAAEGIDYRVVGGHMVQLLLYLYPTAQAAVRGTSDADGGIPEPVAAGMKLHEALLSKDYTPTAGAHYVRGDKDDAVEIDLLVPLQTTGSRQEELGGRTFDAIPGLSLALASDPLMIDVTAQLSEGNVLQFTVPIPNLEVAVVMKALATTTRSAPKDVYDLCTLFEIRHEHREALGAWRLSDPEAVSKGARKTAAKVLHGMVKQGQRNQLSTFESPTNPARFTQLIRTHVAQPRAQ